MLGTIRFVIEKGKGSVGMGAEMGCTYSQMVYCSPTMEICRVEKLQAKPAKPLFVEKADFGDAVMGFWIMEIIHTEGIGGRIDFKPLNRIG
jgi:hypothetical protein